MRFDAFCLSPPLLDELSGEHPTHKSTKKLLMMAERIFTSGLLLRCQALLAEKSVAAGVQIP
jgi:hypothetical protein